jgi:hypothetical protein
MNLGPNISTDGLVLYLDAANVDSFRGEPTINLLYDNSVINWTVGNLTVTVSRTTVIENSVYRITSGNFVNQFTSGSFRFYVPLVKLTNGATYTMSYKWRLISGGPTFSMNDWCDTSLSNVVNLNFGDYNYASATGTRSTYDSTFRFMDFNMSPFTTVEIYDVQLEQKNYSTPFVNGTRGTTVATGGGVADISNNNNHAEFLASTFNSSNLGSLVFDGTDDYLKVSNSNTGPLTMIGTGDCTINFWASSVGSSSYRWLISNWSTTGVHFGMTSTLSRFGGYFGDSSEIRSDYSIPNDGNWHFYTVVRSSGTIIFYVDGTERSISAGTPTGKNGTFSSGVETRIGTRGNENTQRWIGNISICKIYNRALSADEIQQNFNATKTRFGL